MSIERTPGPDNCNLTVVWRNPASVNGRRLDYKPARRFGCALRCRALRGPFFWQKSLVLLRQAPGWRAPITTARVNAVTSRPLADDFSLCIAANEADRTSKLQIQTIYEKASDHPADKFPFPVHSHSMKMRAVQEIEIWVNPAKFDKAVEASTLPVEVPLIYWCKN